MKRLVLSIAFVTFSMFMFANIEGTENTKSAEQSAPAATLSGTVVDITTGEALTGVEVTIEGTDIKVYSDFDGQFSIKDLKPGEYNIVASYISYKKSLIENFTTDAKSNVTIKLQAD